MVVIATFNQSIIFVGWILFVEKFAKQYMVYHIVLYLLIDKHKYRTPSHANTAHQNVFFIFRFYFSRKGRVYGYAAESAGVLRR